MVDELAASLESAGFERGDELTSDRLRRQYAQQPQLHSELARLEAGEEAELLWERLDGALGSLIDVVASARANGADLELDLDPAVRLDVALPTDKLCIDEFVLPQLTLALLGRLRIPLRVSMYRSTLSLASEASGRGTE